MKKKSLLSLVFVLMSVFYLGFIIYQNKHIYLIPYNPSLAEKNYRNSQWQQSQNFSEEIVLEQWAIKNGYTGWNDFMDVKKDKTIIQKTKENIINSLKKQIISDSQLYTYVGYRYIKGDDPTLFNPEHPPLGKYLIGLSILLFHNEQIIIVLSGIAILLTMYFFIYFNTKSAFAASFAVFLTSTHSLFIDQLIHGPQLDIFQLLFLLPFIFTCSLFIQYRKPIYLLFTGICFGFLLSIKMFTTFFVIFNIWLVFLFFFYEEKKMKNIIPFLMINGIAVFVFTSTYFVYFLRGGTIRTFLGVQKYIFNFYRHAQINPIPFMGNYLRLIFTGSWKFWTPGYPVSSYQMWNITWIIIFITGLFVLYKTIFKKTLKKNHLLIPFALYIGIYNIFLFLTPIFPRYILLLFVPIHILISVYLFGKNKNY